MKFKDAENKMRSFRISGNVCIFGDSIVWGAWDNVYNGWVNRLSKYYLENNKDIIIYNLGIPSDTTKDLLKRIKDECDIRKPDTIIIAIGINDTIYLKNEERENINIDEFKNNIDKIKSICMEYTENILFLSLTKVNEKYTSPIQWDENQAYYNSIIDKYNNILKKYCNENKIRFLDISDVLTEEDLFEDGIHPNELGHEKIFNKIKEEGIV